ncbi:MAG: D-glycero-beta-D-manno-heptose 1-phosphate adenylyltransferase [Desulfobacterales bacterium]|jgi:D-beta-D-heptose 7-phosphate kinase/D-beta-D-heptose 1-phosphate adenosyltransferase
MNALSKIVTAEELSPKLENFRRSGKKVVFTNGCFDILHVGHVRYLAAARSEGDLLVVGLNSDASIRLIKGDLRPIVKQRHRAEVLASLVSVNYVVLFDDPDPLKLIQVLQPDVLVKGEDWGEDNIVGAEFVKSIAGRVVRIALVPGVSTSSIIEKVIEMNRRS